MVRYIVLIKFTDRGAKGIKKSPERAQSFEKAAAKAGVTIEGQYWTLGAYDGVIIISAEQEIQALHCLTELAGYGAVRTETMPAFTDNEFDAILGK